jgi:hypothetical protein
VIISLKWSVFIVSKSINEKKHGEYNIELNKELKRRAYGLYLNKMLYEKGIKILNNFKGLSKDNPIKKMDFDLTKFMKFFKYEVGGVKSYEHPLGFIDKMIFVDKENKILILYNLVNWKKINKRVKYFKKIKRKLKMNNMVRKK